MKKLIIVILFLGSYMSLSCQNSAENEIFFKVIDHMLISTTSDTLWANDVQIEKIIIPPADTFWMGDKITKIIILPADTFWRAETKIQRIIPNPKMHFVALDQTVILERKLDNNFFQKLGFVELEAALINYYIQKNQEAVSTEVLSKFEENATLISKETYSEICKDDSRSKFSEIYPNQPLVKIYRPGFNLEKNRAIMVVSLELLNYNYYLELIDNQWNIKKIVITRIM